MERSCFFLRLLSALLLLFSQDQRAASYSFENCEIHENLRGRTKVLCYNRNLAEVPTNLPSKLDLLDLSQNKISSLGKSDFRMLNHLQILNVSQNKIYKIEEGTFMYTSCLESLNLTANKLSFLNSSIFDGLVNLTTLLLGSNRISRIEPSAFAHLKKLKVIDLSSNRLHVLTSMNALFNVESLEELHIKGNGLQNFSTKDIISMPKQLHELDVSCNPISLIDIGTPVLKNLLSFNVSLSNVSTVWQIEDPCFLKGLKTLYLGGMMMKPSEISELLQKLNCSLLETIHLNNLFLSTSDGLIEQVCLWQQNTKTLNLQHNLFTSMKPGTFENCTQLKHLNMAFNRMKRLPKTLFQSLHSFQSLSLANNNFTKVPNAVSNLSSLQSLDLSFNKIDRVFPLDFFCLNNLTSLSIAGNRISDLHSDLFSNLSRLQELNLQNNIITEIKEPFSDNLKMLETLILNQNNLDSLSKGIFRYLISLRSLNLADNRIVTIERGAFEGLRNLKNLVLGSNKISRETLHEGVFEGASSLAELQLFNNYINYDFSHKIDSPPFQSLKSLTKLNINSQRHNGLKNFPVNLLEGLESIIQIHAGNLAVSFLDPKTFSYTPTLQELDLSKNNFLNVSSALFQPIPNLTELHLNQNGLNSLSFVSGVNFSKLTLLRVAGNQIDVVTKKQIMALPYLLFLDLRQNPFICSCSNEMFVNWSLHDPKTQVLHFYQYTCASPPTSKGKKLSTFPASSCLTSYGFILFVTSTIAVALLMFVCLLYEWRLHMLYTYYLLLGYFIDKRQKKKGMKYDYDAFLSFNTHDEAWVMNKLLPVLEGQYCWRLCLHYRDFEPGRPIMENIVENIYASRKTICIISRHYLESEWCSKEIQVASFRLFDEHKDVLVLIFLDEIPREYLSPYHRMRKLIKKKMYLGWPHDEKKIPLFWQKLNMALKTGEGKEDENAILAGFIPDDAP